MRHHVQWGALGLALVILACALVFAPSLREEHRSQIPPQVMADALAPEPESLRWLSLGHREAVADLLWLQAQSYAGLMLVRRVAHEHHLEPLIDGIIALDPNFYLIYLWAGTMLFYEEEVRAEAVLNASRYLRMGTIRFPRSWRLHLALAINLWHELQMEDPEALAPYRAEAALAMRRAAGLPGAPGHLTSVADRLYGQFRPYDETLRAAHQLPFIGSTHTEELRRQTLSASRSMVSPAHAEALGVQMELWRAGAGSGRHALGRAWLREPDPIAPPREIHWRGARAWR